MCPHLPIPERKPISGLSTMGRMTYRCNCKLYHLISPYIRYFLIWWLNPSFDWLNQFKSPCWLLKSLVGLFKSPCCLLKSPSLVDLEKKQIVLSPSLIFQHHHSSFSTAGAVVPEGLSATAQQVGLPSRGHHLRLPADARGLRGARLRDGRWWDQGTTGPGGWLGATKGHDGGVEWIKGFQENL